MTPDTLTTIPAALILIGALTLNAALIAAALLHRPPPKH